MPLRACMQQTTHREYRSWIIRLNEQWNRPTRSDNYLMQVAIEIRRVLNLLRVFGSKKQPEKVDPKEFVLEFTTPKRIDKKADKKRAEHASKIRWFGVIKGKQ